MASHGAFCLGCSTDSLVARPGAIAQLGERELCKLEVVGSIPSGSTSGLAVPGGLALGAGGWRVRKDLWNSRAALWAPAGV